MGRILLTRSLFTLAAVILAVVLMVVGLAMAQNIITRDQTAALTVTGQLSVDETLVLHTGDENSPMGSGDVLSFGNVSLDAFGTISGGPPRIPLYVWNKAGTDIRLTVEQSGDKDQSPYIEALFGPRGGDIRPSPRNVIRIAEGETYTADLGMNFAQAPGTGSYSFVVNFSAEAIEFGRSVAIACNTGSTLCTNPTAAGLVIKQVLDTAGRWDEVKIVDGSLLDTEDELAEFGVVIIGGSMHNTDQDFGEFEDALKAWVENGGGVVATGWALREIADSGLTNTAIGQIMPVAPSSNNTCCGGTVSVTAGSHPLAANMADFNYPEFINYGTVVRSGATVVGTDSQAGAPAVIAWDVGQGRVVYLSPNFYTNYDHTHTSGGARPLLDGTTPAAKRAFIQAVMWASGMDPSQAPNAAVAFIPQAPTISPDIDEIPLGALSTDDTSSSNVTTDASGNAGDTQ